MDPISTTPTDQHPAEAELEFEPPLTRPIASPLEAEVRGRGPATTIAAASTYYRRFDLKQRYLHGVVMVTFLGLALTGMILRFSGAHWALAFAGAVGGFSAVLFLHKLFALLLTIGFLAHLADLIFRGFVLKEKGILWGSNSMVPRWKDLQDLYRHFRWFLWFGPRPKFDHFAYWEKFDYWAVFWGMAIIGISGYVMWFASFFTRFFPGSWLNVALLIHGEEALLAVWFIFAIHFFNTHLRPGSFPMDLVIFTGRESGKDFEEKRTEEFQRLADAGSLQTKRAEQPQLWLQNFGRVVGFAVILCGAVLLWLTVAAFLRNQ